jgi:hypothetical protein
MRPIEMTLRRAEALALIAERTYAHKHTLCRELGVGLTEAWRLLTDLHALGLVERVRRPSAGRHARPALYRLAYLGAGWLTAFDLRLLAERPCARRPHGWAELRARRSRHLAAEAHRAESMAALVEGAERRAA